MSDCKRETFRLSDVATIITGSTPSSSSSNNWGDEVPFLTPSDMGEVEFWPTSSRRLSAAAASKLKTRLIDRPAVAVVCIGATIGKVARISQPTVTNQQINTIIPKPERLDPLYCFYAMQTLTDELKRIASGSATPLLNKTRFGEVKLDLPPIPEQKRIASVLGALDSLIETNINTATKSATLCDLLWSQAFEGNSERIKVSKLGTVVLGGTPSRSRSDYWGGEIAWINSSKANEFRVLNSTEQISTSGLKNSSTKLMPRGATVVAITGSTLGQISRLEIPACGNQSLVGVYADQEDMNDYLYFALRDNVDVLMRSATGGAQQHVNKADVENLGVPVPNPSQLKLWHGTVQPLMNGIAGLLFEAEQLKQVKAGLLGKLIAGDLYVNELAA